MKKRILYFLIGAVGIFFIYLGLCYFKKWFARWEFTGEYGQTHRAGTTDIKASKRRGIFIKELYYKIDSFSENPKTIDSNFRPYLELGFMYGKDSFEETLPLLNTKYPYNLSFQDRPNNDITIFIRKDQLSKFDSSNYSWGYLKFPHLKDTIILDVSGEHVNSGVKITGTIKVWE